MGIDETSLRRGQHYITVVHDLAAKRLLFATEGRSHHSVLDFAQDLKAHGGDPALTDDQGRPPRELAEEKGATDVAALL